MFPGARGCREAARARRPTPACQQRLLGGAGSRLIIKAEPRRGAFSGRDGPGVCVFDFINACL